MENKNQLKDEILKCNSQLKDIFNYSHEDGLNINYNLV